MNEKTLHIKRDGLDLSALFYGDDKAPLVILLHGFPDTPYSWDQVVPTLLDAGYCVLVPWLRGYTRGSVSRQARYDLLSVAADIEAWRQHLLADTAHLVGHDWGAAIAMVLAGQGSDTCRRYRSLSLLAVPPVPHSSQWLKLLPQLPQQLWLSSYMPVMQLTWSHRLLTRNNAAKVHKIWRQWSPGWPFSEAQFAPTRLVFNDPQTAWASTRYYRNLFRLHDPAVREAFGLMARPFTVPTLALAGENDGCMHSKTHRVIADSPPQRGPLTAVQLADCGHFLHAERPHEVSRHLLQHFHAAENLRTEGVAAQA
ncbi:MAG: alpha/beta fold hydrolase [Oceanococcus sp.]